MSSISGLSFFIEKLQYFISKISTNKLFSPSKNRMNQIENKSMNKQILIHDEKIVPHLSAILGFMTSDKYQQQNLIQVSNIIKQTYPINQNVIHKRLESNKLQQQNRSSKSQKSYQIQNYLKQSDKIAETGCYLGNLVTIQLQKCLQILAQKYQMSQVRFWGKIIGTKSDYYIIQGVKPVKLQKEEIEKGIEKMGQGINFYSFWATNNPFEPNWHELPAITPSHVQISRKIKVAFQGNLEKNIESYPKFEGKQKHYLKAQLCRMTHSLQLCPKGIYKVNDDNPKIIEFEDEVKITDFTEMSSLQVWTHKNPMILKLGRCTHYVNPTLSEEQIESISAQLAEKDPQCERLRSIVDDKLGEQSQFGENFWLMKSIGDNQIFIKQEKQLSYGVVVFRNIFWPGWTTIGYNDGYSNFYLGNGLKYQQPIWDTFTNPQIQQEAQIRQEWDEPNPKEEVKIPQVEPQQENINDQQS